jgi:hypothetical protein
MPPGKPGGAMCVQRFDDSRNSAIRITYRISLRSSSMPEPRDPLLKVLTDQFLTSFPLRQHSLTTVAFRGRSPAGTGPGATLTSREPPGGQWRARRSNTVRSTRVGGLGSTPPPPGRGSGDPRSVMILPQVHLRKPCYDFYFL